MSQVHNKNLKDSRDIEQIIYDVVEYQNDEDLDLLYELLVGRKLFLPLSPDSIKSIPSHIKPGEESFNDYLSQLVFCGTSVSGESYIYVFTTNSSPKLADNNYLIIGWLDFLQMVLKIEYISGFGLQGEKSWLTIGKDEIRYILNQYKPSNGYEYMTIKDGGIYSVKSGEEGFSIVKVLVVEDIGVHVCLYANEFSQRPQTIEPRQLQVSIGHAPILRAGFVNWEPELLLEEVVTEHELSGYYLYLDAMAQ